MKHEIINGIWGEAQGDNKALVFETKGREKGSIVFNGTGFELGGVTITNGVVTGSDLSDDLGANPTPLTRTNNPIVGTNKPNANIDVLDAAIGENGDMSENADAQLKIISRGYTVMSNLERLDNRKSVCTVKATIGGIGVPNCTFNVATAANTNEQVFALVTLPGKAKILEVMVFTDAVFTGASTLVGEIGTSSSGHEIMDSTTLYAADVLNIVAADHAAAVGAVTKAAKTIYYSITPGANWSNVTAGKVSVYITYVDVTNI